MKSFISILAIYFLLLTAATVLAQPAEKKVVITGVRFSYPLLAKWIEAYKIDNPNVSVVVETRTTTDPAKYDLLIEAYEPDAQTKEAREFLYLGRYALLPVANVNSAFASEFAEKGLTSDLIKQIYFNDIYADKKKQKEITSQFTVYTRLQKAGAPITFAKYYGYGQANIKGKAISGADEHLVKALLKDSTGISYNVPGLLFDLKTRRPLSGLTIIPLDADDNGKVSGDERFYGNLDTVLEKIESGELKNVPVEFLHLSIARNSANDEAIKFLQWVAANGQAALSEYGFLKLDSKRLQAEKAKFDVAVN
jgi:phosphate transport system substrate-binding protein